MQTTSSSEASSDSYPLLSPSPLPAVPAALGLPPPARTPVAPLPVELAPLAAAAAAVAPALPSTREIAALQACIYAAARQLGEVAAAACPRGSSGAPLAASLLRPEAAALLDAAHAEATARLMQEHLHHEGAADNEVASETETAQGAGGAAL